MCVGSIYMLGYAQCDECVCAVTRHEEEGEKECKSEGEGEGKVESYVFSSTEELSLQRRHNFSNSLRKSSKS